MAASPTPANADLSPCIAVAYSGGRDSTALLHATALGAAAHGVQVAALHVHHGLSAHADEWLAHAQVQCESWSGKGLPVSLVAQRLVGKPARGESIEAWAREGRYRALAAMARQVGARTVLLAHHRRDQAETFLLQALRGAGVAGLAGMSRRFEREGVQWLRPWLDHPREAIEAYVRHHQLQFIDDDSNANPRFARNRLRLRVWPELADAFPSAEESLVLAGTWAAEAAGCLEELAQIDLNTVVDGGRIRIEAWRGLSRVRQANALRSWLRCQLGQPAPSSLTLRLLNEVSNGCTAQWETPTGALYSYRGWLRFEGKLASPPPEAQREERLSIRRAGRYELPGWDGALLATRVKEGGAPLAWLAHLELRSREGGERFQAGIGRPARSLKKQFQAADVPESQRRGPLIYSGGQLVFVPGLGMDARVWAPPGQPQIGLSWHTG